VKPAERYDAIDKLLKKKPATVAFIAKELRMSIEKDCIYKDLMAMEKLGRIEIIRVQHCIADFIAGMHHPHCLVLVVARSRSKKNERRK
jgi:hypothetical protein